MKLVIASDIHGSPFWCRKLVEQIEHEQPDKLVLLGDLLYHGPRNALSRAYNPAEVAAMLNAYADIVVAVRGNCDAEVDQMMLDFPCMGDYAILVDEGTGGFVVSKQESTSLQHCARQLFLTHGHIYGPSALPPHPQPQDGEICFALVSGHTHIKMHEVRDGVLCVNPGSVALPKDGTNSFMVYENGRFTVRPLTE